VIDYTATAAGARLLHQRMMAPLTDPVAIAQRLDAIGFLIQRSGLRDDLRASLKAAPDIARATARLTLQRGGPRDLGAIRDGLVAARRLRRALGELTEILQPAPGELREAQRPSCGSTRRTRAAFGENRTTACRRAAVLRARRRLYCAGRARSLGRSALIARRIRARDRRAGNALSQRDRNRIAENPAQRGAWLFHRSHCDPR
jgi:hypothetical protein